MEQNVYEIPKETGMNVPGVVYASKGIFERIKEDKAIEQVKNVAQLPGIVGKSIALADAHRGYGFCIGGVAAFDLETGIVCPGGIGYDINCGVRLLKTNLTRNDFIGKEKKIADAISKKIPTGVGRGSPFHVRQKELDLILERGAKYMVEVGYGNKDDLKFIEENGCMEGADATLVSEKAKRRGIGQLGTLGAGNHFLDFLFIDEIFDEKTAKVFGLRKNQVVILIHCGSRGLGHQVASDYIKKMEEKYGFANLPYRELVNAPIKSALGKSYLSAMAAAANFAFANKQLITFWLREELPKFFPKVNVEVLYEVCHNIAKIEEHEVDGKRKKVCVHRKGATRSFGVGSVEIPLEYRKVGQPVLIPGSMGTASYVLVGGKNASMTFGSSVHGAGRVLSRSNAVKTLDGEAIQKKLSKAKIIVKSGSTRLIAEEAPAVYKNVDKVVEIVDFLGISKKVSRMKPFIVLMG